MLGDSWSYLKLLWKPSILAGYHSVEPVSSGLLWGFSSFQGQFSFQSPCNVIVVCFLLLVLLGFLLNSYWCHLQGQKAIPSATCSHWVIIWGKRVKQKPLGLCLLMLVEGRETQGFTAPATVFISVFLPRALVVEQCLGSVVTVANRLDCLLIWGVKQGCSSPLGFCQASPLLVLWPERAGFSWVLLSMPVGASRLQASLETRPGVCGRQKENSGNSPCPPSLCPKVSYQSVAFF